MELERVWQSSVRLQGIIIRESMKQKNTNPDFKFHHQEVSSPGRCWNVLSSQQTNYFSVMSERIKTKLRSFKSSN